jgi:hypothetical protein
MGIMGIMGIMGKEWVRELIIWYGLIPELAWDTRV